MGSEDRHEDESRSGPRSTLRTTLVNSQAIILLPNHCRYFIRTVPLLPRDEIDMDDVDNKAEDHAGAETRYRLLSKEQAAARQI